MWFGGSRARVVRGAATACLALTLGGCLGQSMDTTGSVGGTATADSYRRNADALGQRYAANPADPETAIAYAATLRALDQRAQAVAVLQQTAIRQPQSLPVLGAYGKALADAGRLKEAAEVLARAHMPDRPDWRILSAQGAVADQMGEYGDAQGFYAAALKIVPGEPSVLSNQGLSFALAKRLPEAERVLQDAAQNPRADARVRQNLALVLGLEGKFAQAEATLRRDLSPEEAADSVAAMRRMVSQQDSWKVLRKTAIRTAAAHPAAPSAPAVANAGEQRQTASAAATSTETDSAPAR